LLVAAALLAGLAAGVAGAAPTADPGISATSILIGGTATLPDETAVGANAYFAWINGHGGVGMRTISYLVLDDAGDPAGTVAAVRRLVERDGVFAIFKVAGTAANLAVRDYLNRRQVPQLLSGSGLSGLGAVAGRYRYTVGYGPTDLAEGTVYGRYLASLRPSEGIAVLYQDDEDGRELLAGLKRGLGAAVANLAQAVPYDPASTDVRPEVADLARSGASVFMVFGFGKAARQAVAQAGKLGWRPQLFVVDPSAVTAVPGPISSTFTKDPADPAWAKDPGILLFRRVLRAAGLGSSANGGYLAGMASAFTLVDVLRRGGETPTRAAVLRAVDHLNEANNPFLLPGIVVKTSGSDHFPIQQLQLQRWNGARWIRFGGLVTAA
jgi:hypothetical protein